MYSDEFESYYRYINDVYPRKQKPFKQVIKNKDIADIIAMYFKNQINDLFELHET